MGPTCLESLDRLNEKKKCWAPPASSPSSKTAMPIFTSPITYNNRRINLQQHLPASQLGTTIIADGLYQFRQITFASTSLLQPDSQRNQPTISR
ncbi:unnamed protein product [Lactuca virosa]|uniref:Uncharacterized protein n=1 Tax=Lactuca virosa TaxID=75947 RepID=A0AAU9N806_9ASTR|nr:unnamed protein product [Lactuca virosa]